MIISAQEYAEKIGYSPSAITKRLKNQQKPFKLPGAISVEKFGHGWMIAIPVNINWQKAKKEFQNHKKNLVKSI